MLSSISYFMSLALEEAIKAQEINEVPVGAIVIKDNKVIGRGFNSVIKDNSVSSHAEIKAINQASQHLNNYRLIDCDIFVTLEPCLMCCGALIHARFDKVIFSTQDKKSGAVISNGNLLEANFVNHSVKFEQGPLQEESSVLLKEFFKIKRSKD